MFPFVVVNGGPSPSQDSPAHLFNCGDRGVFYVLSVVLASHPTGIPRSVYITAGSCNRQWVRWAWRDVFRGSNGRVCVSGTPSVVYLRRRSRGSARLGRSGQRQTHQKSLHPLASPSRGPVCGPFTVIPYEPETHGLVVRSPPVHLCISQDLSYRYRFGFWCSCGS